MKSLMNYKEVKYSGIIILLLFSFIGSGLSGKQLQNLKNKVENALQNKFEYNNNLEVSVTGAGDVQVTGKVNSLYDKFKAFDIISRVPGVKKIDDNLLVNTPDRPDKEIQDRIKNSLELVSAIKDPQRIKVHVDNGVVILSGTVSFYREKELAQSVSSWQNGVKGLVNNIKVLPLNKAISDSNLEKVLNALMSDEFPGLSRIKVSVNHGVATVTGTVNYLYTKKDIGNEIYNVIGINDVINKLVVAGKK